MNAMAEAGRGAVREGAAVFFWSFDEHHGGKCVGSRQRRPEERHELEGRAERECGEAHCDCKEHPEADADP
jgi:hypothetical protein